MDGLASLWQRRRRRRPSIWACWCFYTFFTTIMDETVNSAGILYFIFFFHSSIADAALNVFFFKTDVIFILFFFVRVSTAFVIASFPSKRQVHDNFWNAVQLSVPFFFLLSRALGTDEKKRKEKEKKGKKKKKRFSGNGRKEEMRTEIQRENLTQ